MQVVVDGILTHYEELGNKKKDLLLILHGWKRSLNEWLPTAKALSDNYRVVLLDLPGFGGTAMPESAYSIYDYVKFVEHFLNKLDIKKTALLGHSFGGRIGIILGAKTNLLSQLVLVDAAAIEIKDTLTQMKVGLNKLVAFPLKLFFPHRLEQLKSHFGSEDYQNAGIMRDIFVKIVNEDLSGLLSEIKVKTLIVWGERDKSRPMKEGVFIKNTIPHSILRVVWDAGHDPHIEKPREFIEILQENL